MDLKSMQIFEPIVGNWNNNRGESLEFPFLLLLIMEPNNCEWILEIAEAFIHKAFYEHFSVNTNYL